MKGLEKKKAQQVEALRNSGRPLDRDAWLWPGGLPDYVAELASVVCQEASGDPRRQVCLEIVAERFLDAIRFRQPTSVEEETARFLIDVVGGLGCCQDDHSALAGLLEIQVQLISTGADEALVHIYKNVSSSILSRCRWVGAWDNLILNTAPHNLQPLHLPAVKQVLGSLIPEKLHHSLDKAAKRMNDQTSGIRGAVHTQCYAWP